jgi:uncharacterized membrane protein
MKKVFYGIYAALYLLLLIVTFPSANLAVWIVMALPAVFIAISAFHVYLMYLETQEAHHGNL